VQSRRHRSHTRVTRSGHPVDSDDDAAREPTLRLLSLGAGVQSTALLILAARGALPRLDGAIFADTGWEPASVYEHLDRLEQEVAIPAGIAVHRVSVGNIRQDALDPHHRFASMPLYVRGPCPVCRGEKLVSGLGVTAPATESGSDGRAWHRRLCQRLDLAPGQHGTYSGGCPVCGGTGVHDGMGRRQCTSVYKLRPIKEKTRRLLGAPQKRNGRPGSVPAGRFAEAWIGISEDERDRAVADASGALRASDVSYCLNRYPLLELGLSRGHCQAINAAAGFPDTPKSACIGCPYHTNQMWRTMRDLDPVSWVDAVDFDVQIRRVAARATAQGNPLRGQMYLHRTRVPLDQAPISHVTAAEWSRRQGDLVDELAIAEFEDGLGDAVGGCSPYACREGS
jgi:hypothetical protein